jgi:hypothetical protein
MKLKDININAEDLLNFLKEHLAFEETHPSEEGTIFELRFFHKIEVHEVIEFIHKSRERQIEKSDEIKDQKQKLKCLLQAHKDEKKEIVFRITGSDLKNTLDKTKDV